MSSRYDDIAEATKGLTIQRTLLALSSANISKEDAEYILIAKEVSETEIEQAMATYGVGASQVSAASTTNLLSNAFKGLTVSIKATVKAIGAFIVSNPVGWIVGIIGAVTTLTVAIVGINKKIEENREKIIEAGETARDEISQIKSELEGMEESVESAGKSFAELVEGINTFNNANISLSDEEYEEFKNSSNELAELFPELVVGLDSEGNAILNLGDNAEEATTKLNELIEAQRNLVASETQEKLSPVFKGIYQEARELNNEIDELTSNKEYIEDFLITDLQGLGVGQNISLSGAYLEGVNSEALILHCF